MFLGDISKTGSTELFIFLHPNQLVYMAYVSTLRTVMNIITRLFLFASDSVGIMFKRLKSYGTSKNLYTFTEAPELSGWEGNEWNNRVTLSLFACLQKADN